MTPPAPAQAPAPAPNAAGESKPDKAKGGKGKGKAKGHAKKTKKKHGLDRAAPAVEHADGQRRMKRPDSMASRGVTTLVQISRR